MIWIAGLFPWGVITKSKLFINRLITPVFRLNREVFLKGFILISLTLLFIFFTYPFFNKYIVDILCTTISVLIFSFILDKGKLSDLKPIRYMQIILFTYVGTFLFVLFVLFIYQYISDSFIYCAPVDIVSTKVVTTPLEGLLDNTLTTILWLFISLGLFFYIFFYRFFSAYFFKFFLALPFMAESRFAKYFQPFKDYNDRFYFSLLLILAFFIFGYLIVIYFSVSNLNENLDKYILVYTHLKFK